MAPKKQKTKRKKKSKRPTFAPGTVVVFDPSNFNPDFWKGMAEEERIKYYGSLGYGAARPKFFTFICEIRNAPGHCILIALDNQKIETMLHISDFREVTEDEF